MRCRKSYGQGAFLIFLMLVSRVEATPIAQNFSELAREFEKQAGPLSKELKSTMKEDLSIGQAISCGAVLGAAVGTVLSFLVPNADAFAHAVGAAGGTAAGLVVAAASTTVFDHSKNLIPGTAVTQLEDSIQGLNLLSRFLRGGRGAPLTHSEEKTLFDWITRYRNPAYMIDHGASAPPTGWAELKAALDQDFTDMIFDWQEWLRGPRLEKLEKDIQAWMHHVAKDGKESKVLINRVGPSILVGQSLLEYFRSLGIPR
jgi:hypothetical protein